MTTQRVVTLFAGFALAVFMVACDVIDVGDSAQEAVQKTIFVYDNPDAGAREQLTVLRRLAAEAERSGVPLSDNRRHALDALEQWDKVQKEMQRVRERDTRDEKTSDVSYHGQTCGNAYPAQTVSARSIAYAGNRGEGYYGGIVDSQLIIPTNEGNFWMTGVANGPNGPRSDRSNTPGDCFGNWSSVAINAGRVSLPQGGRVCSQVTGTSHAGNSHGTDYDWDSDIQRCADVLPGISNPGDWEGGSGSGGGGCAKVASDGTCCVEYYKDGDYYVCVVSLAVLPYLPEGGVLVDRPDDVKA